ncbi:MAG: hypothetical protein SynsKO_35600 [Synoicihabitans sp.]
MTGDIKVLTITDKESDSSYPCASPDVGWLRSIREAQGLSRRHIAEQLGVTIAAVQDYERSEAAGKITLTTLRKYAEVLKCHVTVSVTPKDQALSTPSPKPIPQPPRKLRQKPLPARETPLPAAQDSLNLNDRMGLWSAD